MSDVAGRCLRRDSSCDVAEDNRSGRVDSGGGVHSRTTAAVSGNSAWFRSTLIASSRHSSNPDDYSAPVHHINRTSSSVSLISFPFQNIFSSLANVLE